MMESNSFLEVGEYKKIFNDLTGQVLPCGPILQSSGLKSHVKKHHPEIVGFMGLIPQIIENPDFIGHNPKEPSSIELVKIFSKNLMVCIKVDKQKNYLYVASLYDITDGKMKSRIKSGRLKPFKP